MLLGPDKFSGSLTAVEVCAALTRGITTVRPDTEIHSCPVADGGDGTLDAAVAAGFERIPIRASGPTGELVDASYARRGTTAVVELAAVCGRARLAHGPAPLTASSAGAGEALRAALDSGCRRIILALGGSASTDGGAGLVQALGARLTAVAGDPIGPGGAGLAHVADLDLSRLHPGVRAAEILVAVDVDNPLLGPLGAAAVYGPQKGAGPDDVVALERALTRWADVVGRRVGDDHRDDPGAGAAGGVGFAAIAILGATLKPGIELILDLVGFSDALRQADLVITGEGSLDEQTRHGKAPAGVAAAARAIGVTTVAVAGRVRLSPLELAAAGIAQAYALTDLEPDPVRSMADAGALLERVAATLARDWIIAS